MVTMPSEAASDCKIISKLLVRIRTSSKVKQQYTSWRLLLSALRMLETLSNYPSPRSTYPCTTVDSTCVPEACRKTMLLPSRSHCQASHEVARASDRPAIQSRRRELTRLSSSLHKCVHDSIKRAPTANHLQMHHRKRSTIAELLLQQPHGVTSRTHHVPESIHLPT